MTQSQGVQRLPDVEILKRMVRREKELRLSLEWQERFAAAERELDKDWLDCVEELQSQVVREFGFHDKVVHTLRTAHLVHPSDQFFREVPLHVRYNRARNGPLVEGAQVPVDVRVARLDGTETPLWNLGGDSEPLVLIGGSRS